MDPASASTKDSEAPRPKFRLMRGQLPDEEPRGSGDALEPENWYAWERIRVVLAGREIAVLRIGDHLGLERNPHKGTRPASGQSHAELERSSLMGRLLSMNEAGLVHVRRILNGGVTNYTKYSLTPAGTASLRAPGPPKRDEVTWARWAGRLAYVLSERHGVSAHQLLRETVGPAVRARARLFATCEQAGWPVVAIAAHFGVTEERVRLGLGFWDRMRSMGLR